MNGQTRYHAEIKVNLLGREARINVFADTLAEIFNDLGKITEQIPDSLAFAAKREIVNAELKAEQLRPKATKDAVKPPTKLTDRKPAPPVCPSCGANDQVELIRWADKVTSEAKQAWKCQACKQWLRPNGKQP